MVGDIGSARLLADVLEGDGDIIIRDKEERRRGMGICTVGGYIKVSFKTVNK